MGYSTATAITGKEMIQIVQGEQEVIASPVDLAAMLNAAGAGITDPVARAASSGGPLLNGVWVKLPGIYKLLLGGTGNVTIATRARDGTVTANAEFYSLTGPSEDYPYFDSAYEVRATLTGTATAEIV